MPETRSSTSSPLTSLSVAVRRAGLAAIALVLLAAMPAAAVQEAGGETGQLPTIEEKTEGMEALEGYFDLYWDGDTGKLYWEIARWDTEFLYQVSLAAGLGSNPVGLDRGQLGETHVLEPRRVGPKVLLEEPNYRYRARDADSAEVAAVENAFARGTLWGFEAVAESGERVLVDATDFFLRDAHDITQTLEETGQGSFSLDESRSTVHLPRTKAFPKNTEVEATLTFTSEDPGNLVRATAADGEAVTLRVHHSLVELPDTAGYDPRPVDPRVGAFGISFQDYSTPIDEQLEVRWASRHRLHKQNPGAGSSPPVEPLVYYVDAGTPEPIRSALVEGASWWNRAFEAAGYEDAFRVRVLPDSADPMDIRYNMIHWTHRRTRGWSYGSSVVDPRTGEILKANVNLGSLRLRQDYLIGKGLAPPFASAADAGRPGGSAASATRGAVGSGVPACDLSAGPSFGYLASVNQQSTTPRELALARVRQLSAHEVGHTLGFSHNYIASTYAGRASVMDYPAPLVNITSGGGLDLSNAYDVGIGEYDEFAVTWLYEDFPEGRSESAALDSIVRDGLERGIRFISDQDARPEGAAHALAGLWDNGEQPAEYLSHEYRVRRIGLENFGPGAIRRGKPMAGLEEVLVPLYLHHRYQLEVAAHSLGGYDYNYALRGDGQAVIEPVAAETQHTALDGMLRSLEADFLALPERILEMIPPRAFGMAEGETFGKRTYPTFDPLGAAASSARYTLRYLLQPERMARLVEQHRRTPRLPGLAGVVDSTIARTWRAPDPDDPYRNAVQQTVESVVLHELMEEAGSGDNTELVRGVLSHRIDRLADWLEGRENPTPHERLALEDIRRWQDRPEGTTPPARVPELPPGSPIGSGGR